MAQFLLSDDEVMRLKEDYRLESFDIVIEISTLLENFESMNLQEFTEYSNLIVGGRPRISELLEDYHNIKSQLTIKSNVYKRWMVLLRLLVFQFMVEGCTKQMFRFLLRVLAHKIPTYKIKKNKKENLDVSDIIKADPRLLENNLLPILGVCKNELPVLYRELRGLFSPPLYELRHAIAHHRFYIAPQGADLVIYYEPDKKLLLRKTAKRINASDFFKKMDALQAFWVSFSAAFDCIYSRMIKKDKLNDCYCKECSSLKIYVNGENPPTICDFCGCKL